MQQFEHQIECCAVSFERISRNRAAMLCLGPRETPLIPSMTLTPCSIPCMCEYHRWHNVNCFPPHCLGGHACLAILLVDLAWLFPRQNKGYSVIAYDAYGCGDSPKPHNWDAYSHKEQYAGASLCPMHCSTWEDHATLARIPNLVLVASLCQPLPNSFRLQRYLTQPFPNSFRLQILRRYTRGTGGRITSSFLTHMAQAWRFSSVLQCKNCPRSFYLAKGCQSICAWWRVKHNRRASTNWGPSFFLERLLTSIIFYLRRAGRGMASILGVVLLGGGYGPEHFPSKRCGVTILTWRFWDGMCRVVDLRSMPKTVLPLQC